MIGEIGILAVKRVYLAGGFRSGWQDQVMHCVPELEYLDPRSHGFEDEAQYTKWDLEAIASCDLVFAYFEASNPAGYSLALEIGYAKALDKYVIYVDEKSARDPDTARYLGMVRSSSNV